MRTKNLPLIVGISLPIIFVIAISIVVFISYLSIRPQYDFLYSFDSNAYYGYDGYKDTYAVENGAIVLKALAVAQNQTYKGDAPTLYLYDVKTNSSHEVSFNDAQGYSLDTGPSSPDGYMIKYEYENGGVLDLFGSSGNDGGYFVEKGDAKKRLPGIADANNINYQGDFNLIGWIK